MALTRFTVPGVGGQQGLRIYAEPANLNYFLKTPLTPDAAAGPVDKQSVVKAHSRRQGPGDTTPISVRASNREWTIDASKRWGSGLPGRSVVLVADAGLPGEERRQFTVKGDWNEFTAWLGSKAKMQIEAYNHTGAHVTIPAATAGP
jgi:hypothetical protein